MSDDALKGVHAGGHPSEIRGQEIKASLCVCLCLPVASLKFLGCGEHGILESTAERGQGKGVDDPTSSFTPPHVSVRNLTLLIIGTCALDHIQGGLNLPVPNFDSPF